MTRTDYPDGTFGTFDYDASPTNPFGQLAAHRMRNGGVERREYDARCLAVKRIDAVDSKTLLAYDGEDRLQTATDPRGATPLPSSTTSATK